MQTTVQYCPREINTICNTLNPYLDNLNNWFKQRKLSLSTPKSSATLFTTWSNEVKKELPIIIDGAAVPTKQDPKILGVTLDPMMSFKHHVKAMKDKINN